MKNQNCTNDSSNSPRPTVAGCFKSLPELCPQFTVFFFQFLVSLAVLKEGEREGETGSTASKRDETGKSQHSQSDSFLRINHFLQCHDHSLGLLKAYLETARTARARANYQPLTIIKLNRAVAV